MKAPGESLNSPGSPFSGMSNGHREVFITIIDKDNVLSERKEEKNTTVIGGV